jgi:pSer/pThr/pTyr-binding forkhead associated (FHA) protein
MAGERLILKRVTTGVETELTGPLTVGRSAESGLMLPQASRRHALIALADGAAWVEDLGSTNGTFVNERRVNARTRLSSGDRIRFDLDEFEFRVIAPEPIDSDKTKPRNPGTLAEKKKTPGSWAANDEQAGGSKTMLVGSDEMRNKLREEKSAAAARAPQRVDTPSLIVSSGSRANTVIPLRPSGGATSEWTIGSDAEREIVLEDSGVSGLHARIVNEGNRWQLSDQLSANGTFVNGNRINMSYLSSGDSLRFGPVQCRFQLPERGFARLGSGSGDGARRPTSTSVPANVDGTKGSGTRLALIAAISFIVTVLIIGFVWWHMSQAGS